MQKIFKVAPAPVGRLDLLVGVANELARLCREFADPNYRRILRSYIAPIWKEATPALKLLPRTRDEVIQLAASGQCTVDAIVSRLCVADWAFLTGAGAPGEAPGSSMPFETRAALVIQLHALLKRFFAAATTQEQAATREGQAPTPPREEPPVDVQSLSEYTDASSSSSYYEDDEEDEEDGSAASKAVAAGNDGKDGKDGDDLKKDLKEEEIREVPEIDQIGQVGQTSEAA